MNVKLGRGAGAFVFSIYLITDERPKITRVNTGDETPRPLAPETGDNSGAA